MLIERSPVGFDRKRIGIRLVLLLMLLVVVSTSCSSDIRLEFVSVEDVHRLDAGTAVGKVLEYFME